MTLRDVIFKPICKIDTNDGVKVIRANGDHAKGSPECFVFVGDKVKNATNEPITIKVSDKYEVVLQPNETTTIIPLSQKTIANIVKIQQELINGKSLEELENTVAGKEIIEELTMLSDVFFIESGHYSNIFAYVDDASFSKLLNRKGNPGLKKSAQVDSVDYSNLEFIHAKGDEPPVKTVPGGSPLPKPLPNPSEDNDDGNGGNPPLPPLTPTTLAATWIEDVNRDNRLTIRENKSDTDITITKLRVYFPNVYQENDTIVAYDKDDGSPNGSATLTADDVQNGYVDIDVSIYNYNDTLGVEVLGTRVREDSDGNIEVFESDRLPKNLYVEGIVAPVIDPNDIIFPEDFNKNGRLSFLENAVNPNSTTVRIKLPDTIEVDDQIRLRIQEDPFFGTNVKTITQADITRGYIDYDITIGTKTSITPIVQTFRDPEFSTTTRKTLNIDSGSIDDLSLTIDPINGTGHIGNSDLSHKIIKAVVRVNNGSFLNDGYEVELEINNKTIKATKQNDGTFAADIKLSDYRDDADHKIVAKLKGATYNIPDENGVNVTKNMPEKSADKDYNVNITGSLLRITKVNDHDHDPIDSDFISLADIKNNKDIKISGEVRGIYQAGDTVHLTLPSGNVVTATVDADGTFSTTVKSAAFGYPQNLDPDTYVNKISHHHISATYTNSTGTYNDAFPMTVNLNRSIFGLVPTFEKADSNNSDIAPRKINKDYPSSLSNDDTDKLYSEANGSKFKLNLDFGATNEFVSVPGHNKLQRPDSDLTEDAKKAISKVAAGWKYEVYLTEAEMSSSNYDHATFSPTSYQTISRKIFEGTIEDGKTKYSHDFDIKDYLPTKPTTNKVLSVNVKLIPPAGDTTHADITIGNKNYVFSAPALEKDNQVSDASKGGAAQNQKFSFVGNLNMFADVPESPNNLMSDNFKPLSATDDPFINTIHATGTVNKFNISGFVYKGDNYDDYKTDNGTWTPAKPKPEAAYLEVNGNKYAGEIDNTYGRINFKGVTLHDLQNDDDHIYQVVLVKKDRYGNSIRTVKNIDYNIVTGSSVTQEQIEKGFNLSVTTQIAREKSTEGLADSGTGIYGNSTPREGERMQQYEGLIYSTNNEGRILSLISNKYATHFDYDFKLKVEVTTNSGIKDKLWWFDPSDGKIKEITNGEITIKAGTNFKDIRIVQSIKDDDTSNFDVVDTTTNEYGGITTNSNMALKKQKVTITLKTEGGDIISTKESNVADNDYDIAFNFNQATFNIAPYVQNQEKMDGDRNVTFKHNGGSAYTLLKLDKLGGLPVEFLNEDANVTISSTSDTSIKKLTFSKGDNVLNLMGNFKLSLKDLTSNMSAAELATNPTYTLTLNRSQNARVSFDLADRSRHYDFQNLHLLRGASLASNSYIDFVVPSAGGVPTNHYVENLKSNENLRFNFRGSGEDTLHIDHLTLDNNGGTYRPKLGFASTRDSSELYEEKTTIDHSVIAADIDNAPNLDVKNSVIGTTGSSTPTEISLRGDFSISNGSSFANETHITAKDGEDAYSNKYFFDITIDKDFTLTDTSIDNAVNNKFVFGSNANISNLARFNVDSSDMIFESGSVFNGHITFGDGMNSVTIKNGATFNGTIEMSDAMNNITIEDGAILGPNFHINETKHESETDNGRIDSLTVFENLDFQNLDISGIEKLNIGTEARGEMINLDLVFADLYKLLSNDNDVIKLWGDADNNVTLRNEANKTFVRATDQSGVGSEPYTRYEAHDTITNKTYYVDIHNDINLHIL